MSMFLFSIWTLTVPRTLNSLWKGARHAAEPGGRLSPRRPLLSSWRDVPRLRRSRAAPGESAAEGLSEMTRNGIRETCPERGAPQGAPPPAVRAGARVLPGRASRTCGAGAPRFPSSRRPRARKCLGSDEPRCERRQDNDHSGGGDADVYLAETARPALPGRFARGTPKSPRTAPALSPPPQTGTPGAPEVPPAFPVTPQSRSPEPRGPAPAPAPAQRPPRPPGPGRPDRTAAAPGPSAGAVLPFLLARSRDSSVLSPRARRPQQAARARFLSPLVVYVSHLLFSLF